MSDVDDLVAAMVKGDPHETVPLDVVTAMALSVIRAHFIPCPHIDHTTVTDHTGNILQRWCSRCGAILVVKPEDTDGS